MEVGGDFLHRQSYVECKAYLFFEKNFIEQFI